MPMIDLKNCTIRLRDGFEATGAVNNGAGYAIGVSTITVDGFTEELPEGAIFTIGGEEDREYVIASTVGGATPTSITFDPPLVGAINDDDVIDVGGRCLNIKVGEGNLTWSESKAREYKKDRGRLDQVRNGDEEPMDVSCQLMYEELTAASTSDVPTVEDVLKRRGNAADWVNANVDDPCTPYSVHFELLHNPAGCTVFEQELVRLPEFRYEKLDHDPKAGTIAMTGKSNATEAEVSRLAISV